MEAAIRDFTGDKSQRTTVTGALIPNCAANLPFFRKYCNDHSLPIQDEPEGWL